VPDVRARGRIGRLLLVLALGALLYLPGLGREILRHPLEAKYALAAREMLRGGPWLVAHLFGQIYPDKPPLYFWATAAVADLRGGRLDEVAARLPAAAGALATLALTLALGETLFGAGAGLASATVLATSGLFFWYARQGHPDQFLTAGVTLACLGLWRTFAAPAGLRRTGWVLIAYTAMALAVLSKGLLGLVLPLLAGTVYLALTGPLRAMPGSLGLWPGLPVFLAIVLSWYGPAVARHGAGYLRETIVHQQIERYARSFVHHGPWYYYVPEFTTGFLPWSLFVPGAVALAWRAWRGTRGNPRQARAAAGSGEPQGAGTPSVAAPVTPASPEGAGPGSRSAPFLFPLCWFAAGFVFFSLSTGKRGAYLLPLYPAAALLVGWVWVRTSAAGRGSPWLGVPVALLAGIAALLALGVLLLPRRLIPGRMVDTLVPADPVWQAAAAVMLLAGAAAVWATWQRARPGATLAVIVAVQALSLHGVAFVRAPQYEARYPARELAGRIAAHVPPGEPVLSLLGDYDFLVAFYLDRSITPLPGPSELLAARRDAPRFALLDQGDREVLAAPGVLFLAEGRLGPKRIVLVRLDARPG
jgi:4-amino-4-deoxy-L-arabinose transferase-like glycosyltransferase